MGIDNIDRSVYVRVMKTTKRKSEARQRIIETAEMLFYAEGVRTVGIDRVIAESKVAKMTLYNHFKSKDELILEVLKYRDHKINAIFDADITFFKSEGMTPIRALFATIKKWFDGEGFRGCAFLNASAELADANHPGFIFSAEHKNAFRKLITDIVVETNGPEAEGVAQAISLLVEGAIVTAVLQKSSDAADVALAAAETLLQSV